jgi:hypothetical protein
MFKYFALAVLSPSRFFLTIGRFSCINRLVFFLPPSLHLLQQKILHLFYFSSEQSYQIELGEGESPHTANWVTQQHPSPAKTRCWYNRNVSSVWEIGLFESVQ